MKTNISSFILALTSIVLCSSAQRTPTLIENDFNREYFAVTNTMANAGNINTVGNAMLQFLLEMETPTQFDEQISVDTRRIITTKNNVYGLVLLERALKENQGVNFFLKEKLLNEINDQIDRVNRDQYPLYTYDTRRRSVISFIGLRSGNDLFTLAGLFSSFFLPSEQTLADNQLVFQRNDDRDYTGSFLLEIGTSYFNVLRRRPLKTYQTLLYGFDVYTPYFKDTAIFRSDTSFNRRDRPHATFQYFGWSKKGLAWNDNYRWMTTLKVGTIGGSIGQKFQNTLHQDISYSPRPKGWGAQIARNGRFGISFEGKQEFVQLPLVENNNNFRVLNVLLSPFLEEKIGTYITAGSGGLQFSNKRYSENAHNFINHRTRQTVNHWTQHIYYNIGITTNYIFHNTMLEGYGIFQTKEKMRDDLTPLSRHYLSYNQVRRFTQKLNVTLSYTTRFATIFYNWMSFSPETTLGPIGILSPHSGKEMNISGRWHHFAEIGLTLNIR